MDRRGFLQRAAALVGLAAVAPAIKAEPVKGLTESTLEEIIADIGSKPIAIQPTRATFALNDVLRDGLQRHFGELYGPDWPN